MDDGKHYCAALTCPGYAYRASDRAHPCPSGASPESIRAAFRGLIARAERAESERDEARANLAEASRAFDGPETGDFLDGVRKEAAHQIVRWGVLHDAAKGPEDFFWLVGYLAGKALAAAKTGDAEKAKHHTISTAAVLLNWHARLAGGRGQFQPGDGHIAASIRGEGS